MTYQGKKIMDEVNKVGGLTHSGKCFIRKGLRKFKPVMNGQSSLKKPITEEEAEDFFKKIKFLEYSIIDQPRKTLAQISIFLWCCILMNIYCYTEDVEWSLCPREILVNQLEKIIGKIFYVNMIIFSDNEFPVEGMRHNWGLHITV